MDINYLVFSGGGSAGFGHAGAMAELSKQKDFSLQNVKGVAGVSVGALAALLVSLKYSPQEISNKILDFNLQKITEGSSFFQRIYRLFSSYGQYPSDAVYAFIKDIIKEKTGRKDPEQVTFADLKKLGCIDLYIVTTKMYKENDTPIGKEKIFSLERTPDTSVASAILASMAAPVYFHNVRLKKIKKGEYRLDKNGDLYEDGGIVNNFPINIFDKPPFMSSEDVGHNVNPHTLGFALLNEDQIQDENHQVIKTPIKDKEPFEYAVGIFNALMLKLKKENLEKKENRNRTVQIDRLGVSLAQFDIDKQTREALFDSGRKAVKDFFAQRALKERGLLSAFNDRKYPLTFLAKPANDAVLDETSEFKYYKEKRY